MNSLNQAKDKNTFSISFMLLPFDVIIFLALRAQTIIDSQKAARPPADN